MLSFGDLWRSNVEDTIFEAMRSDNLEEGVLAALNILRLNDFFDPFVSHVKDEFTSSSYRKEGNIAYSKGKHQQALIQYNRALLCAPKDSLAMKLAYSNRSALLLKENFFTACIKDIDTCIAMGCPPDLVGKLSKRKEEALNNIWGEQLKNNINYPPIIKEFFKLKTLNADLPNISADIKVVMEPEGPKVVAATDIKVGTVLALEPPYVSDSHPENMYFSCYYCHKMSLNLMPCDGCCYALYCDEICKKNSMDEGHIILCPLMASIITMEPQTIVAIQAVIKMKKRLNSWKEFMSAYYEVDKGKNDITDIQNNMYKSLLINSNKHYNHFIFGKMFKYVWSHAIIVHWLETKTNFFPTSHEAKHDAILAVSRIAMTFSLHGRMLLMLPAMEIQKNHCYHNAANFGWFPFIATLKHSCQPNILTVPRNKEVALVSVMPIKKGSELTISLTGHWQEEDWVEGKHQRRVFLVEGIICNCIVCSGNWRTTKQFLTDVQTKKFRQLNSKIEHFKFESSRIILLYKDICEAVETLSDAPFTREFVEVFKTFLSCLLLIENINCGNVMIDLSHKD